MLARAVLLGLLLLLFSQAGVEPAGSEALFTYIGDATGWNNAQKIAVGTEGTIHIVYQQGLAPDQQQDLFAYARSLDGQDWEVATYEGRWPAIGLDSESNMIYIAFVRRQAEQDELHVLQIAKSGVEDVFFLSSEPHSLLFPAIVVESRLINLAWEVHRGSKSFIEYAQLDPASRALQMEVVAEGDRGLYFPSLTIGSDGVHLVWEEEVDPLRHRIVHGRRDLSGWQVEAPPEGSEPLNARYPALDYDPDGQAYELVFVDYATAGNRIYYQALSAGGWGEPECLSCALESGYWTFPTVEDGNVFWGRQVSAGCPIGPLYYSRLFAGSWSGPQALEGDFAAFPHLFRQGSTLHLIWTDRDPQSTILRLIKYRQIEIGRGSL
jgi:hypothetical protein